MPYEDRNGSGGAAMTGKPHSISLENRKNLIVSGVTEVESFDEHEIILETSSGSLMIHGEGLSISRLSVENGDVNVQGLISELLYEDTAPKQSFWARLLR